MDKETINSSRWRLLLAASTTSLFVISAAAGGIALLRHRNKNDSNNNPSSVRRRDMDTFKDPTPTLYNPSQMMMPNPILMDENHMNQMTQHDTTMDENGNVMEHPNFEIVTFPTSPHVPPVHTDPVEEFVEVLCRDDPNFSMVYKGSETITCASLPFNRQMLLMCGEFGVVSCPETCDMVNECYEETATSSGGGGGDGDDASSSSSTMTTGVTTSMTSSVRQEYWYPIEPKDETHPILCIYSSAYPDEYLHELTKPVALFDTEEECCALYHNCQAQVITPTLPTLPTSAGAGGADGGARVESWYPSVLNGKATCQFGSDYPEEFVTAATHGVSFLFSTISECCTSFPSACLGHFWHPSNPEDIGSECVYGQDFPESIIGKVDGYLFFNEEECCEVWCGSNGNGEENTGGDTDTTTTTTVATTNANVTSGATTGATTVASATTAAATTTTTTAAATTTTTTPTTTTTTATTTTTTPNMCTDCTWHESSTSFSTCTNSLSYPPQWDEHPMARAWFFFETAEECCETRYPGACTLVDVHASSTNGGDGDGDGDGDGANSEYTTLGPRALDDFDGEERGLPFDFGTPVAQWTLDDTVSYSGTSSITNIPFSNSTTTTADLTLKISVGPGSYTVRCMALVDISMPYDSFYLEVNGEKRNSYFQRMENWFPLVTGFGPGENTLVFRVEDSNIDHQLVGEREEANFGTGRVWLDDCDVSDY